MAITKTLYGISRQIPETDETGWGLETTNLLVALTNGAEGISLLIGLIAALKLSPTSTALAGGATLTVTHPQHAIAGSGAPVTLSASTAIADGAANGQVLLLRGTSNTNTVTIPHGANTQLNGTCTLGNYDTLLLCWDGADWFELSRTV